VKKTLYKTAELAPFSASPQDLSALVAGILAAMKPARLEAQVSHEDEHIDIEALYELHEILQTAHPRSTIQIHLYRTGDAKGSFSLDLAVWRSNVTAHDEGEVWAAGTVQTVRDFARKRVRWYYYPEKVLGDWFVGIPILAGVVGLFLVAFRLNLPIWVYGALGVVLLPAVAWLGRKYGSLFPRFRLDSPTRENIPRRYAPEVTVITAIIAALAGRRMTTGVLE